MADDVPVFDPSVKKRTKPKAKPKSEDSPAAAAPADKKPEDGAAVSAAAVSTASTAASETPAEAAAATLAATASESAPANGGAGAALAAQNSNYDYEQLLTRVFDMVNQSRPESRSKFRVPPPEAFRVGTVRTLWANFSEICRCMNRDPQHVMTFVTIELGTTANLDANNRLLIRGTYLPKHLARIVKRYIEEYVRCHSCDGRETVLSKQQRLYFVQCISPVCGSQRSVAPLNKGYMHQLRRQKT